MGDNGIDDHKKIMQTDNDFNPHAARADVHCPMEHIRGFI